VLASIHIRNIAVIERAELSLEDGLNILTGETGAGKSILIDAVLLVLGARADYGLIRTGCTSAQVEAVFSDLSSDTQAILCDMGCQEEDGSLVLSREITASSRSTCRVNGHIVPLSQLRRLTDTLMDIYGQHDQLSLLQQSMHARILDAYGGRECAQALETVRSAAAAYSQTRKHMEELFGTDEKDRERMLDLLRYQIQEIEQVNLQPGEEEELKARQKLLSESERGRRILYSVNENLFSGEEQTPALEQLQNAVTDLARISDLTEDLKDFYTRLDAVGFELEELYHDFSHLESIFDYSEEEQEEIENRLTDIYALKRKYGQTYEEIQSYYTEITEKEHLLSTSQEQLERLEKQRRKEFNAWLRAADVLSALRQENGRKLSEAIEKELSDLGMTSARFSVELESAPREEESVSSHGLERVQFLLSANRGEALRSLEKVASGGEMSRIMLALKVITADLDGIDCMIFDEIDAGISGTVSLMVARKLAEISRKRQVICITHTAQIAAMADNHYRIRKEEDGEHTFTRVDPLDDTERLQEVSRLLGGESMSSLSLDHARDMAKWCAEYKSAL